jgi:hypothetical protein
MLKLGYCVRRQGLLAWHTLFAVTLVSAHARADVTVQEKITVQGSGIMSFANMSGTSTHAISGKRSRSDADLQMESRLVRMFARGVGQSSEIVLLDEDKVIELDPQKKEYREVSLADRRAQLAKAASDASQNGAKQPAPTGMDESQCDWSEPKVEVTRPGGKTTIAGFAAEQANIVVRQTCTDRKTGNRCDIALALDSWVAPEFDDGREVVQFSKAYAEQMGLTSAGQAGMERAAAIFGRYKDAWTQVAEQMRGMQGYPVRSTFAFGLGGGGCTGSSGESAGTSSSSNDSPAAVGAQIVGSLFGRKKQPEATSTAPATEIPALQGMLVPITVSSELVSASREALPAGTFEVPAGYKKVSP